MEPSERRGVRDRSLVHAAAGVVLVCAGVVTHRALLGSLAARWASVGVLIALWGSLHLGLGIGAWRGESERERWLHLGWPAWVLPIVALAHVATGGLLVAWVGQQAAPDPASLWLLHGPSALALSLVAAAALERASQAAAEARGLVRTTVGALAALTLVSGEWIAAAVVSYADHAPSVGDLEFTFAMPDESPIQRVLQSVDSLAAAAGLSAPLYVAAALAGLGLAAQLFTIVAAFWLIPERIRRGFWLVVDAIATLLFVGALWTLPFVPEEDARDVTLPAIALAITTLFVVRVLFRAIPRLLDALETSRFEVMAAARMLRAKKSGFLTAIGGLSILAVSFSSCTLATTLSVMGGFRADLQQKILGNHAHVVIDRTHGTFGDWQRTLERVRDDRAVSGASPYVSGEVMLTSALESPGGAELRGIDPDTLGDATDLPRNMRFGSLDLLRHPERILDLPIGVRTGSLLGPSSSLDVEEDVERDAGARGDAADGGEVRPSALELADRPLRDDAVSGRDSILDEIDRLLDGLDRDGTARPARSNGAREAERDVLPGLVIGQELARSLRLHVGDEVTVVSPNGELGPTGPIPRTRAFRIAGIFYTGMFEYDMRMAYAELTTAQGFLRTGDEITGIEARLHDWREADRVADALRRAIRRDDLRVRSWREVNRNLFGALELEKLAMFITLGIAILVASFCIFAALVLMVQEKGREIGILKAMGAEDGAIVRIFLSQGLLIGVLGASTGLGLGYLVCFAAEHFKFIRVNPEVYYIDHLPVSVDASEFAWVGVAAVVVCVLATIYPAVLGSRLRPVEALRQS